MIHVPVLLEEVLTAIDIRNATRLLDCTVGLGGHSKAALTRAPQLQLCGIDRDAHALEIAEDILKGFGSRVHLFHGSFADFETCLEKLKWDQADAALLDLGVSSLHLDTPERGFSYRLKGPLDMRMDQESISQDAYQFVNRAPFPELRDCIALYGEDPQAGRIARAIINAREKKTIEDTLELAEIIRKAYPPSWRASAKRHPATRTFQAIRMMVNDELGQLKVFLEHILPHIQSGGRLAIISFHSLEDRMVKHTFRDWAARGLVSIITKKPLAPTEEEIVMNPRAGSAKLRAVIKLERNS